MKFNLIILAVSFFLSFNFVCSDAAPVIKDLKRDFGAMGDGIHNDHSAFLKAAAYFQQREGKGKLIIPYGTYLVGNQITDTPRMFKAFDEKTHVFFIRYAKDLVIEGIRNKAGKVPQIIFKPDMYFGSFYIDKPRFGQPTCEIKSNNNNIKYAASIGCVFYFSACQNIKVSNLELNGNIEKQKIGGVWGDVGIQLAHMGVLLSSCKKVKLEELNIHHFGLDAIQIKSNSTYLSNVVCEYNGRQGLSWVDGDTLVAEGCKFNYTGCTALSSAPGAGIDFEPEAGKDLKYSRFTRCEFAYNKGPGILNFHGKVSSINTQFNSCTFVGYYNYATWFMGIGATYTNCKIYGSTNYGVSYADVKKTEDQMRYINCYFSDIYLNKELSRQSDFMFYFNSPSVLFQKCTLDVYKRQILCAEVAAKDWRASSFDQCVINNYHNSENNIIDNSDVFVFKKCKLKLIENVRNKQHAIKLAAGNSIELIKEPIGIAKIKQKFVPFVNNIKYQNCFNQ